MVVLANIIAYLFILTAIGLFVVVGCMVAAGFQFYGEVKRVKAMAERPKNVGMEIFRLGKGIALRDAAHIRAIGVTGRGAFETIMATKDDLLGTAKSIDMGDAKEAATSAREAVADALSSVAMALQIAKQIMGIVSQASQSEGAEGA